MSFQEQEQYIPKVAIYKYYLNAINFYGFYLNIIYTSTYNATRNATQCTIWYIQNLICRRNKTHFRKVCFASHYNNISTTYIHVELHQQQRNNNSHTKKCCKRC